jgi:hypothetical protein
MAGITQRFLDPSRAVTRRLDPKALVVEWVIGLPPQSRFEMTLAVAFGLSRELKRTGTAGDASCTDGRTTDTP